MLILINWEASSDTWASPGICCRHTPIYQTSVSSWPAGTPLSVKQRQGVTNYEPYWVCCLPAHLTKRKITFLKTYIQYLSACGSAQRQTLYPDQKVSSPQNLSQWHRDLSLMTWSSACFLWESLCHRVLAPDHEYQDSNGGPSSLLPDKASLSLHVSSESSGPWYKSFCPFTCP